MRHPVISLSDPRKRETGTSYTANGAITPPKVAGEQGSAGVGRIQDVVPELSSPAQARLTYARMASNDSAVATSLRAGKMPILGATFYMQPFDEKQINLDIAEFCEFNILEGTSTPFMLILQDVLRFYEDGFSVLEKVYENREWTPKRSNANRKVYTMLKKLAVRPPSTISEIKYDDNGGPQLIKQRAIRADGSTQEVTLDIGDLVIFTNERVGGSIEGKSILRTAYKHWYYKDKLYIIDGIQKERHGIGFPVMHLPPGYTEDDKKIALEMVQNIRTNESAGAVLPTGWDLEFITIGGNPVDLLPSIEHHNGMIMLNIMVQFLLMGLSAGGGRATSTSAQDMFNKTLRYIGNYICEVVNLYVIPQLVAYNFQTDQFPQLRVRNIGETKDLQQWAAAMANLLHEGAITADLPFEQWVREVADAPLKVGDRPEAQPKQQPFGGTGATGGTGGTAANPTGAGGSKNSPNIGTTQAGNSGVA